MRVALVLLPLVAGCASAGGPGVGVGSPSGSEPPTPRYFDTCAPVGVDTSNLCLRLTLQAIDTARSREGLAPMDLPADFARLSVAEQLFVAVDRERVDRGLAPFAGLSTALDADSVRGAETAELPPDPGGSYNAVATEWIGAVANGLDADYQWMYDDGVGAGVPGCTPRHDDGCWVDRHVLLGQLGPRHLVMGAAFDPTGDTFAADRAGSSLAATFARGPGHETFAYTWAQALAATAAGTLRPLRAVPAHTSLAGVPDPPRNVAPNPDFTQACASSGLDESPTCLKAILAAVNHAHALEGVRPMVLPADFSVLGVPQQLFVAVNLERVDRGLPPFGGLTTALDQNAQRGADKADDPPDLSGAYVLEDAEWAGGSANGLDAVYGWMYDDGLDSGNLDCTRRGAPGCWGHRRGILDDFGSGNHLAMGAAVEVGGDTHPGDRGGTSMAVTLAVAASPEGSFAFTWAQALAALPASGP